MKKTFDFLGESVKKEELTNNGILNRSFTHKPTNTVFDFNVTDEVWAKERLKAIISKYVSKWYGDEYYDRKLEEETMRVEIEQKQKGNIAQVNKMIEYYGRFSFNNLKNLESTRSDMLSSINDEESIWTRLININASVYPSKQDNNKWVLELHNKKTKVFSNENSLSNYINDEIPILENLFFKQKSTLGVGKSVFGVTKDGIDVKGISVEELLNEGVVISISNLHTLQDPNIIHELLPSWKGQDVEYKYSQQDFLNIVNTITTWKSETHGPLSWLFVDLIHNGEELFEPEFAGSASSADLTNLNTVLYTKDQLDNIFDTRETSEEQLLWDRAFNLECFSYESESEQGKLVFSDWNSNASFFDSEEELTQMLRENIDDFEFDYERYLLEQKRIKKQTK